MKIFSNEIVFRGHPDKVCDQISDALLDAYLSEDKSSRCGIEVMGGKGKIFVTGEVTSSAKVNVSSIVKKVLNDVGYDENYEIINNLGVQSIDIALGTNDKVHGAGDNGMMFGYACRDTKEYLPTSMVILQKLSIFYDELRKKDKRFLPDGKAQITGYYENNKLVKIKDFVICYQNTEEERDKTDEILIDTCKSICNEYNIEVEKFILNPTGKFLIGGFTGDAGLTGRKIIVDTYGGYARHGGGAFSGKDPTKVDRSAAYMARYIAKNVVAANMCDELEIQLSYAIGVKEPTSIYIDTKGTEKVPHDVILEAIKQEFDLTPAGIIHTLNLRTPIYKKTASYGHFGRPEANLPWEQLDKVENLKKYM